MKNKTTKKLLLPLFIMALCFISIETSTIPSALADAAQIMPLSDREDIDDDTRDH